MASESHVYVLRGDVTKVACDAWLLPTDASLKVETHWSHTTGDRWGDRPSSGYLSSVLDPPDGWGSQCRSFHVPDWGDADGPETWFTDVGADEESDISWYVNGATQFLDLASADLRARDAHPRHGRARHLLALHVVGSGQGGAMQRRGEVLDRLLPALEDAAERSSVDVVLVVRHASDLVAAQRARNPNKDVDRDVRRWVDLTREECELADRLGDRAAKGELVLFIGAGVSAGAGLPLWQTLLDGVARRAEMSDDEINELHLLDMPDQAAVLEARRGTAFSGEVTDGVSGSRYAQAHGLLASLPIREVVTLNYDDLFEIAAEGAGWPAKLVPQERPSRDDRWLLKLHGSIHDPGSIVLTRRDYLQYDNQRSALLGVVQALLLTRHMLFIGFSLNDGNFHRIVDQVRRALDSSSREHETFGTALTLHAQPLLHELWEPSIKCQAMAPAADEVDPAAARKLEVFLDRMLFQATSSVGHLLVDAHQEMLEPLERELRDLLVQLRDNTSEELRSSPIYGDVHHLLERMGGPLARQPTGES